MRIALFASGSRGDIQPLLAVAVALRRLGHQVRFCAHEFYQPIVAAQQCEFFALGGASPQTVWADDARHRPSTLLGKLRWVLSQRAPSPERLAQYMEGCEDAGGIVCDTSSSGFGLCLAEKLQLPIVVSHLYPAHPTRMYPNPTTPLPRVSSGLLNLLTHLLARLVFWIPSRRWMNAWRTEVLELRPLPLWEPLRVLRRYETLTLFGFSPAVVPRPRDWPSCCAVTGFWFLEDSIDPEPPEALQAFLRSGEPPVSVGFGSLSEPTPEITTITAEALGIAKQRAVLVQGWAMNGGSRLPDTIHVVDSVRYSWLFPQVSVAVHAGGAGTTAEAIRAGIPSVVVPVGGDQRFWARRLAELGIAPPPIRRAELTPKRLAEAIERAVTDGDMRRRARALGELVRQESGPATAARLIMGCFGATGR